MTDPVRPVAPREPVGTIAKLIEEGESDHAGLCTQFDGCWHCRVLDSLRDLEKRTDGYPMPAVVTSPTDGSNDAIRRAALDTASRIGMFAATWPEFYAFGLAVKASLAAAPVPCAASPAEKDYRRCGYCHTWATKPCGEQCCWSPDGETVEQARATGEGARDDQEEAKQAADCRREAPRAREPIPDLATCAVSEVGPADRSPEAAAESAPVAVSLDPHRLLREPLLDLQAYGEEESANAIKDKRHDDYRFWQGWNSALERALSILDAARLRGEATVRVEE